MILDNIKKIENYLNSAASAMHFTGVVLIAHHGEIIFNRGYGMATPQKPNDPNTIFHIGSITKQFTAAALLKLVEAGMLNLHTSINEYLPKEYQSKHWEKVTIHHLLSHTSGIVDYDETYYDPKTLGFVSPEIEAKMIQETGQKKLEFKPGTKFNYCNIGYTLLGIILEEKTGQKYIDIIQEFFLTPLGMEHTSFHKQNYQAQNDHAIGYRWNSNHKKLEEDHHDKIVGTIPDGGMLSTTHNLYLWSVALEGKHPDILSVESVKKMTSPVPQTLTQEGWYGYGLGINTSGKYTRIHHSGWMGGFLSEFLLYPKIGRFILILCNNTAVNISKTISDINQILD
jgi:CubicO group peptidase (beta-lactamase class C family)